MGSELLRRVRWRNVARVVAAVAVVAAVVAWPRLGPPRPRVPDPIPRPVVTMPESVDVPRVAPTIAPPVTRPRRRGTKVRRATKVRRPRRVHPDTEGGVAAAPHVAAGTRALAVPTEPPEPVVPNATPARDPADAEFGFER